MSKKLLIVDDESTLRTSFKEFLAMADYEVETAANSDEAVKLIKDLERIFKEVIVLLEEIKVRMEG